MTAVHDTAPAEAHAYRRVPESLGLRTDGTCESPRRARPISPEGGTLITAYIGRARLLQRDTAGAAAARP